MRTFKRFLSLALVLIMAISMMSVAVFADDATAGYCVIDGSDTQYKSLQEAVNAAADGATITVYRTISDADVTVQKGLTITGADGATLKDVTINEGPLPADTDASEAMKKYKYVNIKSADYGEAAGAGATKEYVGNTWYLVMTLKDFYGIDTIEDEKEPLIREEYLKELNSTGFHVTIKQTDGSTVTRYIPKAELEEYEGDGKVHYYKIDNVTVNAGQEIQEISMFLYDGARVYGTPMEVATADTNVDIYLRMMIEGDVSGETLVEGTEYYTKYYLDRTFIMYDNTEPSLTVKGLNFTGNSCIKSEAAVNLTVENCKFNTTDNSPIQVKGSVKNAAITGNTFGAEGAALAQDAIVKFENFTADGAAFNLTGNTVYATGKAFSFSQLPGVNYTVTAENNQFFGTECPIWMEAAEGETGKDTSVEVAAGNKVDGNAFTMANITYPEGFEGSLGVNVTKAGNELTSGTFNYEPDADQVAEGYRVIQDGTTWKIVADVEVTEVKHNLDLSSEIDFRFLILKTDVPNPAGLTATIQHIRDEENGFDNNTVTPEWESYNNSYWQLRYNGVAAKEMTDDLILTITDSEGLVYEETYSVQKYAMDVVNKSTKQNSIALMKALLRYGGAAQINFNYKTGSLADSVLGD